MNPPILYVHITAAIPSPRSYFWNEDGARDGVIWSQWSVQH